MRERGVVGSFFEREMGSRRLSLDQMAETGWGRAEWPVKSKGIKSPEFHDRSVERARGGMSSLLDWVSRRGRVMSGIDPRNVLGATAHEPEDLPRDCQEQMKLSLDRIPLA